MLGAARCAPSRISGFRRGRVDTIVDAAGKSAHATGGRAADLHKTLDPRYAEGARGRSMLCPYMADY